LGFDDDRSADFLGDSAALGCGRGDAATGDWYAVLRADVARLILVKLHETRPSVGLRERRYPTIAGRLRQFMV
jgi:hypothetical protein